MYRHSGDFLINKTDPKRFKQRCNKASLSLQGLVQHERATFTGEKKKTFTEVGDHFTREESRQIRRVAFILLHRKIPTTKRDIN